MARVMVVGENRDLLGTLLSTGGTRVVAQVQNLRSLVALVGECQAEVVILLQSGAPGLAADQAVAQLGLLVPRTASILLADVEDQAWRPRRKRGGQEELVLKWPDDRLKLVEVLEQRTGEKGGAREPPSALGADHPAGARTTPSTLPRTAPAVAGPVAVPQIISVIGPKGGVGKTTIAVNLAVAMGRRGQFATALLDLNLRGGDVAVHLDLLGGPTLVDLLPQAGELTPELLQRYLKVHRASGLSVMTAPERPELAELVRPGVLARVLETVGRQYRYVVLDHAPDFTSDLVCEALERSHLILLVSTLEACSLRQCRVSLETLRRGRLNVSDRVRLVLNQVYSAAPLSLTEVERFMGMPVAVSIPEARKAVEASIFNAQPLLLGEGGEVGRALMGLSRLVDTGAAPPPRRVAPLSGVLEKLVRRASSSLSR